MAKISPQAQSIIEVARSDYKLGAEHKRRLREQIAERARRPETERPSGPRVLRSRAFWLLAGGALFSSVVVSSAVMDSTSDGASAQIMTPPAPPRIARTTRPVADPNTASPSEPAAKATAVAPAASVASESSSGTTAAAEPKTPPAHRSRDVRPAKSAAPSRPSESAVIPERAPAAIPPMPDEMRILREAHAALKNGALTVARARLNDHAAAFPRGVFREEGLTLSALVYCAEGRRDEARREADALAREYPHSSHLERLRGSCAAD